MNYTIQDLVTASSTLYHVKDDLSDSMQEAFMDWRDDLKVLVAEYKKEGSVSQDRVDRFVEDLNIICEDDGMPSLFPEQD